MKKTSQAFLFTLACCGSLLLPAGIEPANHAGIPNASNNEAPQISNVGAKQPLRSDPQHDRLPAQLAARAQIAQTLLSPAIFEPAAGAAAGAAQFIGHAQGVALTVSSRGINVQVPTKSHSLQTLAIRLRGSGPLAWSGEDKAPGEANYFFGNDAREWRTRVARYNRVESSPSHGISLAVHAAATSAQPFEYDVRAAAGADVPNIRLEFSGAHGLRINRAGDLFMRIGDRQLEMRAPAIYEQASTTTGTHKKATSSKRSHKSTSPHSAPRGSRRESASRKSQRTTSNSERRRVRKSMHDDPSPRKRRPRKEVPQLQLGDHSSAPQAPERPRQLNPSQSNPAQSGAPPQSRRIRGGYVLEANGSVGFWLGKRDPNAALLIDPSISLTYATFLGGTGADSITSIATDSNGNVYLGGTTTSATSFVEGANVVEGSDRGATQLFIAKVAFAQNGIGTLQYLTFFGGSNLQYGGQVAVDPSGNAAILGVTTSPDYPVTDGRLPTAGLTGGTGNDAIVSEIDPTGSNLLFSTLFGGSGAESKNAAAGIAFTSTQNIPAAEGGIAFDSSGNVYIASDTTSQDLPTTANAYQTVFKSNGPGDGFLVEFQPQNVASGTSDVLYCTYLGTGADKQVAVGGVAVDSASPPNVYIGGLTTDNDGGFPFKGAFQSQYGGDPSDAFVMKIFPASAGSADLIYATLLGGTAMDEVLGVSVDTQNPANAYVVGATQSPSFSPDVPVIAGPGTALVQNPAGHATQNAFLAVVAWNPATLLTSLQYFTYLGGSQQDAAQSVSSPFANMVYVAGSTTSYDFAWHNNLQPFNGSTDAFLAKLDTTQSGAASLGYVTPLGGSFITPSTPVATMGNTVASDGQGHAYLAGQTTASDFSTAITTSATINGFQQICSSCQQSPALPDAFLAAILESSALKPAVSFRIGSINFTSQNLPVGTAAIPQPVVIYNSGGAGLNFSTTQPPAITGANAPDFSISLSSGNGCPQPLPPGQGCVGEINFVPSVAGLEGAAVSIADDAPGSPQTLELIGMGEGPVAFSPTAFAFGNVSIGQSEALTVILATTQNLTQLNATLFGPDTTQFGSGFHAPACESPLQAGQTCQISYAFNPTALGTFHAEVDVTYQIDEQIETEALPLVGTGVPDTPFAVAEPTHLTFPPTAMDASSPRQSVLIANTGSAPLYFAEMSIGGPDSTDFTESENCQASLEMKANCTASIEFAPQSIGSKTATFVIADNASGSPQIVTLTGTSTQPPSVQVSPANLTFTTQSVGTESASQPITITNGGTIPLSFTQGLSINGSDPNDFSQTNNCNVQAGLQPNASCIINAIFAPAAVGARSATLSIADSAPGSPQTVGLSGTGLAAPEIQLSPTSWGFAPQSVGTQSAAEPVTITNVGTVPLSFTEGISIAGADPNDFSQTNNCNLQAGLQPNAQCTVNIVFSPATAGNHSASLSFADSAVGSPQTVPLTGTGLQANATIIPTNLTFAGQQPGSASTAKVVTITSTGPGQPLTVSKITITGTNAADFAETDNCQSPVSANCAVNVTFAPVCKNESASRSATLTLQDNGATPSQAIVLTGTASGDFCVASSSNSPVLSVTAGATASYPPISLISVSSFSGTVNLTCSVAPAGPTCGLSPSSAMTISPNVPAQFEVQAVTTGAATSGAHPFRFPGTRTRALEPANLAAGLILSILIFVLLSRREPQNSEEKFALAALAIILLCVAASSCGNGSTSAPVSDPTSAGTYAITVSATEGAETQTITLQFNVSQ